MPRFLLDVDALSGAVETFEYDHGEDRAVIRRTADVQAIIDRNKELQNHGVHQKTPGDLDMRLVASIPIEVTYVWLQRYGVCAWKREHWDKVKQLLNDNEWRYLRVNNMIL